MKRIIFTILFLPYICFCVFEDIGVSVKGKLLGEGFTVICDGVSTLYYNPSKLGLIKKQEISIFYQDIYNLGLLTNMFIGYVKPRLGKGGVGIGWVRMGTTNNVDFMNYSENTFIFSYGQKLSPNFSVGCNIKFFYVDYDYNATGYGMDLGCIYRPLDIAQVAAVFKNLLSSDITWQTGTKETLPPIFNLGISNTFGNFSILCGIFLSEKNFEPSFGVIYKPASVIELMLGTRLGQKENTVYSSGLELQGKRIKFACGLEYHKILGFNTFFELGYKM